MKQGSVHERRLALSGLVDGYKEAAAIATAAQLGVWQALHEAPATGPELARKLGTNPRNTTLLLDALAALELLAVDGGGRYRPAGLAAEFLVPGAEYYMGDIIRHNLHMMRRWVRMEEAVRSGEPVPKEGGGRSLAQLRAFIMGMQNISLRSAEELADLLDLGGVRSILDLAGGPGTYLHTLLDRLPEAAGAVLDLPEVVEIAREETERRGLAERVRFLPGDMFELDLEGPWDLVLLSNIIHSWGEETNETLFARIAAALAPGGRLVVKDFLLEESGIAPAGGALFSLNMMVSNPEGRSWPRGQVQGWMEGAGLAVVQAARVGSYSMVLVGRKGD